MTPAGSSNSAPLSWIGIARLGLVQTALGAIFVLSTSTLNRVMKVELALPAVLPGLLIALQYWIQVLRPRLGHGSDLGGRRTPFIIGGMAVLAAGGLLAAMATGLMTRNLIAGLALAVVAFAVIGIGVSAAGTALLVLLAARTEPKRRPAAATIAWLMMIVGFIVTAGVARKLLDPFSPARLILVAAVVSGVGFVVTCLAVWRVEGRRTPLVETSRDTGFGDALREVWAEPHARLFAIFVFVSMLAYGGEELMIEPFAGALFGMTPGETAGLSGVLHGGSLAGMVGVAIVCTTLARSPLANLRSWMVGGCLAAAVALVGLAVSGLVGTPAPIRSLLFALGAANGGYAIAAIATMMQLVGVRGPSQEGVRMGLWGAAQGVAFGCGGLAATILSDVVRHVAGGQPGAYATVFGTQAAVFCVAAAIALRLPGRSAAHAGLVMARIGAGAAAVAKRRPMIALATDAILALVVLEAAALSLYHLRTGRGIAPARLLGNLAAGFFLVLAVRLAVAADGHAMPGQAAIGAALFAALLAHIVDLAGRWRA